MDPSTPAGAANYLPSLWKSPAGSRNAAQQPQSTAALPPMQATGKQPITAPSVLQKIVQAINRLIAEVVATKSESRVASQQIISMLKTSYSALGGEIVNLRRSEEEQLGILDRSLLAARTEQRRLTSEMECALRYIQEMASTIRTLPKTMQDIERAVQQIPDLITPKEHIPNLVTLQEQIRGMQQHLQDLPAVLARMLAENGRCISDAGSLASMADQNQAADLSSLWGHMTGTIDSAVADHKAQGGDPTVVAPPHAPTLPPPPGSSTMEAELAGDEPAYIQNSLALDSLVRKRHLATAPRRLEHCAPRRSERLRAGRRRARNAVRRQQR